MPVRGGSALCVMALLALGCEGVLVPRNEDPGARDAGLDQGVTEDAGAELDLGSAPPADTGDDPREDAGAAEVDMGSDIGPDLGSPFVGSAGCGAPAGIPEGENTFMLEGTQRRFVMRLPSNYSPDRAWPLIFALHGNGGSVSYWDGTSGDRDIRGEVAEEAIVVVAEAIDNRWRDYDQDRSTWPERMERELRYFDHLIEESKEKLCVDERAIFSMGFSGGGSFSGVLGCRRDDIRAIAVGGSVIYFEQDDCVGTPAAWITIGTQELEPPREAYRDFFRDRAGCSPELSDTSPSPCRAYAGCGEGTPVHYCQHPAGHVWPDFGVAAAWAFFEQFVEAP